MLNAYQAYLDEEHFCPHCKEKLTCCNVPPFHVGDGLGWGTEIFFICLNDECSLFVNGWKHIEEQYSHVGSYRYMLLPGEKKGTPMVVVGKDAFKGCVVDPEALKLQDERYAREKEAVEKLDTCLAEKNLEPVLTLLLDNAANREHKIRAVALLTEFNDLSCIDPIRNHTFIDPAIEADVIAAIDQILQAHFKKECPFCAEIIKKQAKVCMHCNKKLK